jgi:tetratricopeptide (TPR) repeat protein
MWRREPEKTLEIAREALRVAQEVGAFLWQGRAMSLHHWAATTLDPQTAVKHSDALSVTLSRLLKAGPYGRTAFTPSIVEVHARAGRNDLALHEIDDALAFAESSDERAWAPELHRLRGELVAGDDRAEAERAFTRALEVSRRQGARSFELRAATSLAELAGRRGPALDDLRRVRASFDEGLTTGDIVEADAVLRGAR